jgi:hypothetical protein
VNRSRGRVVRRLPKLSLACDSATHLILSAIASTGGGGDQRFFPPLLDHACRRAPRACCVVADAGYDSENNHRLAREQQKVRSIIPPTGGRPRIGGQPPAKTQPHRRNMHHRFRRKADHALYGQRWQSETVNSMIKRNLGSALRARTTVRRRHELLLRVLTHNIMILANG